MLSVLIVGALFGAFIGSFLNVCIHRLPRNESVVMPPSRCYSCGTGVQWYDNLPVVAWLLLRGRCRWCGSAFSARYLALELLVAGLTAGVLWAAFSGAVPGAPWLAGDALQPAAAAAALLVLVYALVVATFIDLEHLIIPDELTKSLQVVAPGLALLTGANLAFGADPGAWLVSRDVFGATSLAPGRFLAWSGGIALGSCVLLLASLPLARRLYGRWLPEGQRWNDDDHRGFRLGVLWFTAATALAWAVLACLVWLQPGEGPRPLWVLLAPHLAQALFGSLAGWMSLYLVGLFGTLAFRRNAMGFGDVKLLAPIGAFVGPIGVVYVFFSAAVIGSLVGIPQRLGGQRRREIPFGPYLAIGALVALVAGPHLHRLLFPAI